MGVATCASMNLKNRSTELDSLWKNLTEEFRRACLMRRQGDSEAAGKILNEELPKKISQWSRLSPSTEAMKREQLNQMFERERERIEDAWMTQQILLRQMRDVLIPSLCLQVAEEVREVMELQVGEITRNLATASSAPAPISEAAPTRQIEPEAEEICLPSRGVSLPMTRGELSGDRPNFADLPAIIDELIDGDLNRTTSENRIAALV